MDVKETVEELEGCLQKLTVEVPAEEVSAAVAGVVQEFRRKARVDGFRKGKVPVPVIRTRFREGIAEEAADRLVRAHLQRILEARHWHPLTKPRLEPFTLEDARPFTFTVLMEIAPELTVTGYKGLPVRGAPAPVTEADVEAHLTRLRQGKTELVPAEGDTPAEDAVVLADVLPVQDDGRKIENLYLSLAESAYFPQLVETLRQMTPGEERTVSIRYAEDYLDPALGGQTRRFQVRMKGIKRAALPDLDDAFAKSLGDFPTLADLRAAVRRDLEAEQAAAARRRHEDQALDVLWERHQCPLPASLVQAEMQTLHKDRIERQVTPDYFLRDLRPETDPDHLRREAERRVRNGLLLDAITRAEDLKVSDEAVDAEIQKIAERTKQPFLQIKRRLREGDGWRRIRDSLLSRQVLDILLENAHIEPGDE